LSDLFPILLVSAVVSIVATPLAIRLSRFANLVDYPGTAPHKRHSNPTPIAGGFILIAGLLAGSLIKLAELPTSFQGILIAAVMIFLMGLIDDRLNLSPVLKLLGQAVACSVLIIFGIQVRIFEAIILNYAVTFLWVIGITNAINFVDSMDGLALGLSGVCAAFFMLVTLDSAQPGLAALSAAILGASLGGFFYNTSPAKFFLGDSGAQLLGVSLAAIGIAYTPAQAGLPQGVTWFTPILVLGVPIFDTSLVVFSRLRRGLPVYRAGLDHTYHRLIHLGLDQARAILAMQLTSVFLGLVAFIALDASVLFANILFIAVVLGGIGLVVAFEYRVLPQDEQQGPEA
jgi:UDP-GlcNAc:undecaprenyl-phosphate GlcNAc-1-phosphate transferase